MSSGRQLFGDAETRWATRNLCIEAVVRQGFELLERWSVCGLVNGRDKREELLQQYAE